MTGARHLLLAVLAAVLALALGLALGAGPVVGRSEADRKSRSDRLAAQVDDLEQRVAELQDSARTGRKVLSALAGPLTKDRLTGHSVLLVRTPGADDALVRRTRAALLAAGASLTGELSLSKVYTDPAKASSPLEDLALRLVPPNVTFPEGASAIERVGIVLARATVATEPAAEPDQDGAELIAGLDELGALTLKGDPGRQAQLAVVVTGERERQTGSDAVTALVRGLDAGSQGAVLVGPGLAPPAVGWLRSGGVDATGGASSVDSADTSAGQVALVLALAEQLDGGKGAYGAGSGATSVLPASLREAAAAG
jgi:hypothetical protein